jgi:hypothetical protein
MHFLQIVKKVFKKNEFWEIGSRQGSHQITVEAA